MELPDFNHSFLPVLTEAFTNHADKTCVSFQGTRFTYAEIGRASSQVPNQLIAEGFRPGMKGAVYSLNSALSFIATLGIIRAGGTWIPVNPRNSGKDNQQILGQFGCDALFYQVEFAATINNFINTHPVDTVVCLDGHTSAHPRFDPWLSSASSTTPAVQTQPTDIITIPQTGGTTGLPKGVMLSNRNFCALTYGLQNRNSGRATRSLVAAPMTHAAGRGAVCGLASGVMTVILESLDPQVFLKTIETERITDTFLPPTGIYTLLDQANISEFDLSSLQYFSYGSAPISTVRLKEALRTFGPVMLGGFGQTECPMFISRMEPHEHFANNDIHGDLATDERLRSVGRATVISELRIVDDDGKAQPPRELGEIAVKGPMVSEGYYENPEETAKIRVNGWHLTGDIGFLDEDSFLYIVDRKKDMIITGGFNVYSTEVEQSLMQQEGIQLAAVIGIPDEQWGEAVAAYVVLQPGAQLSADDIIAAAKAEIGSVKAPKQVMFRTDFPRTPIGKIDKKKLRDLAWANETRKI